MRELNRFLSGLSALSGIGMFSYSVPFHDISTALSGVGAMTMAVILFQMADTRERLTRIEAYLLNNHVTENKKAKGHSA